MDGGVAATPGINLLNTAQLAAAAALFVVTWQATSLRNGTFDGERPPRLPSLARKAP